MGKCRRKLMSIIAAVAITSSLFVGTTLTSVSATEVNSNESIYSQEKQASECVVYFVKPSGWGAPRAYVYTESGSVTEYAGKWPGTNMKDEGNGLYSYTLPSGVSNALVIFNDGSNQVPGSGLKGFEVKNGVPMKYENGNWEIADTSLRVSSISTDVASPQSIDTEIAITANATGGSGNVSYRFTASNGTDTQVLSDYSSKSTINWTPTLIGTYTIKVEVKDGSGDTAELTQKFIINNDPIISDKPVIKKISSTSESVKLGSKATFNVNAVGGENIGNGLLFYKFFITEPDGTEKIAQNYSRNSLYTLTANKLGTYKVRVEVQNALNVTVTKEANIVSSNDVIVIPTELKINSFTSNKVSPQSVGTTISLSASAQGEGTLQYKFLVYENNNWTTIKDYSQANSASYTLSSEGEKQLYVDVKDSTGNTVRSSMNFVATGVETSAPVISSFKADKASPQVSGTSVTLTASATGSGTLQYKFIVQDPKGNYTKIQDYSTSNKAVWTSSSVGNNTLYVDVKDSNGKVTRESMSYTVKEKATTAPVISSFKADKASPQVSGTKVTLTASATGSGTLQYKFLILDAKGNWYVLKDYSTSNSLAWTTGATGNKSLYVDVKDSNGKVTRASMAYTVKEKEVAAPVISSFKSDKASPQVSGTSVTLTASATGSGTLQYKFIVQDPKGNFTKIQDYSTSNKAVWVSSSVGNNTLYVDVKDSNGKVTRQSMAYTVKEKVATAPVISSFTTNVSSPQVSGTPVVVSAQASGAGTLQYKFIVQDPKGNYTKIQDYSTSNMTVWISSSVGDNILYVDVKDSNGKVTRKSMTYNVKEKAATAPVISSFTTNLSSPQVSGTPVVLVAQASGAGTLQYKFIVQDPKGNFTKIQDYSTSNMAVWISSSVGDNTLYVDVKDSNGKVTRQSMAYTVKEKAATAPVISSFKADKASPQVSGTSVTLTANATGSGTLQYKFIVQDPKGNYTKIQDYSTSNKAVWVSSLVGDNILYVDVKDSNGKVTREKLNFNIKEKEVTGPVITSFTTDKASPQASGTPIILIGKANGSGTLQYKFLVQDAKGNWTKVQDYATSNMAIWIPSSNGQYKVYLDVKDGSGKEVRQEMTYTIQ